MKIQIKARFTGSVLFEHECDDNTLRVTLEAAVAARADLSRADLSGADLYGADLYWANLSEADLSRANLSGADLYGADLSRADLYGADLYWANLSGANLYEADLSRADLYGANLYEADLSRADLYGADLSRADLSGAKLAKDIELIGARPVLQIGPIGSRSATLVAYLTNRGVFLQTGCFFGAVDQFAASLAETHGDNDHAAEYTAALALIQKHAELWSTK